MESSAAEPAETEGSSSTYILRELISNLPLTPDKNDIPAHITCVDTWDVNLYIGTSAGEVLHYVSIPSDPSDPTSESTYIFASKLEPHFETAKEGRDAGVKQILLIPEAGKACIVCNGMLTFYTLPELSPAYGGRAQTDGCSWVGGLDLNRNLENNEGSGDPVIAICLKTVLRLVRIERKSARSIGKFNLENVGAVQRRGDLVCVADATNYTLLDVVNNRKNDLFNISSLSAPEPPPIPPILPQPGHSRSVSSTSPTRQVPGHQRNASLDSQWPARSSSRQRFDAPPATGGDASPPKTVEAAPIPEAALAPPAPVIHPLPPNILSPTPVEFLLTTGTSLSEPGVGLVINADGDPSGGALEFTTYPEALVFAGSLSPASIGAAESSAAEGFILAIVRKQFGDGLQKTVEIQRWSSDDGQHSKEWLRIPSLAGLSDDVEKQHAGLRLSTDAAQLTLSEIRASLRERRLYLDGEDEDGDKQDQKEDPFAAQLSKISTNVLLFTDDRVSWVVRNPLILQLQHQLSLAVQRSTTGELLIDVPAVQTVINSIRGQEPRDELESFSLTYIRQKASLLLLGNLLLRTARGIVAHELEKRFADEALVAGEIDPRVILSLIPVLKNEIREGSQGILIAQGLRDTINLISRSFDESSMTQDVHGVYGDNILGVVRRYLVSLRKKKGFGSVADEAHVFQTVDATLLHILLLMDQDSPPGPIATGTVRDELKHLVDDRGLSCFDRAAELLEQFHRLYMLSRLYQSRRMATQVLTTWKRILEGEHDAGGEFVQGEHKLRMYLAQVHDESLVREYGAWLANRNPNLGAQVFADENGNVKFEPAEAVAILKEKAPGAVKDYLEHLVFDKHHVRYVNDLIAYYLDTVLAELTNPVAGTKDTLLQSYETYRALRPPKPTYRQFITDNAIEAEWWHNRLRLLQLIGGSHGAASEYDVHALRERLAPHSEELVPEMIILNGREGKHEEALRLLTHGLGDYDTAIRYCLLGGSSIFHPSSELAPEQPVPSKEEQAALFEHLLLEFFRIEDLSVRLERTAELLERFGGWFDIAQVLDLIPDGWSVMLVSGFLIHALRRLVRERDESVVVRALSGAQNIKSSVDVIDRIEELGPLVVGGESGLVVS